MKHSLWHYLFSNREESEWVSSRGCQSGIDTYFLENKTSTNAFHSRASRMSGREGPVPYDSSWTIQQALFYRCTRACLTIIYLHLIALSFRLTLSMVSKWASRPVLIPSGSRFPNNIPTVRFYVLDAHREYRFYTSAQYQPRNEVHHILQVYYDLQYHRVSIWCL